MTLWTSETEYLQAEWRQFMAHPVLGARSLAAVGNRSVATVLDVGCGAGQELIPFLDKKRALGIGVDIRPNSVLTAKRLLAGIGFEQSVQVASARAEALPFRAGGFDLVICRGVLMYTDVPAALAEIRRVLAGDGLAVIQVNNLRYVLTALRRHLRARKHRPARRAAAAGRWKHLPRPRPANFVLTAVGEVFFSRWLLRRELAKVGLHVTGGIDHRNPRSFVMLVAPHNG